MASSAGEQRLKDLGQLLRAVCYSLRTLGSRRQIVHDEGCGGHIMMRSQRVGLINKHEWIYFWIFIGCVGNAAGSRRHAHCAKESWS